MSSELRPERFLRRVEDKCQNHRGSGSVVIVAFGDSVTAGATHYQTFEPDAVYHNRLKRLLEARYPGTVLSVINSGIGGDNTADALKRIDRDVIRYAPDLVLVGFGLNDVSDEPGQLERFRGNIRAIAERIASTADVILMTPTFMCSRPSEGIAEEHQSLPPRFMKLQNEGFLAQFAEAIRDVAAEQGLPVADIYEAWSELARRGVDTTAMLANGLNHPTGEAHAIAAEAILRVITR